MHWRSLAVAALSVLVTAIAVKTVSKALKPGRTGELSRTAFLRWRPQIQALESGTDIYRAFNYPNPPVMALILKPLADLPPITGLSAWFALKVLMAALMAAMIFRLIAPAPLPDWGKALAVLLALHPVLGDLSHGNVNLLISFLVVLGLDFYCRGYDLAAGATIALAIACKITPALFVPYFVWKRAWKTLIGLGLGLALWWAIVPGAVLGFDYNRTLFTSWFDGMVKPFVLEGRITSEHPNQSLPGFLTRMFTESPSFIEYSEEDGRPQAADSHTITNLGPVAVQAVVKGALLLLAAAFVVRARSKERHGLAFAAECGAVVLGMLLFSERTWKHHATTLLLPTAVLVAGAMTFRRRALWVVVIAVPIIGLLPSAMNEATQDLFLVYGVYTLQYLLLLVAMFAVMKWCRTAPVTA